MLRITHFREKCIGCNGCVEVAPDRWRMSKTDGKSTLIEGKPKKGVYNALISEIELEENQQAAANCPVNIIRLKEV